MFCWILSHFWGEDQSGDRKRELSKCFRCKISYGFAKWIIDKDSNQILGASIVGKSATDLNSEATIAKREELTINDIRQTVHAHPTLSEIWYKAASQNPKF